MAHPAGAVASQQRDRRVAEITATLFWIGFTAFGGDVASLMTGLPAGGQHWRIRCARLRTARTYPLR